MSNSSWFQLHYPELSEKYGGKWVLISEGEVIYSDTSFGPVYKRFLEQKEKEKFEIALIETGDAAFYEIKVCSHSPDETNRAP